MEQLITKAEFRLAHVALLAFALGFVFAVTASADDKAKKKPPIFIEDVTIPKTPIMSGGSRIDGFGREGNNAHNTSLPKYRSKYDPPVQDCSLQQNVDKNRAAYIKPLSKPEIEKSLAVRFGHQLCIKETGKEDWEALYSVRVAPLCDHYALGEFALPYQMPCFGKDQPINPRNIGKLKEASIRSGYAYQKRSDFDGRNIFAVVDISDANDEVFIALAPGLEAFPCLRSQYTCDDLKKHGIQREDGDSHDHGNGKSHGAPTQNGSLMNEFGGGHQEGAVHPAFEGM